MPQLIIVVGGSVAGLIHGVLLKRDGHNVTILERDPRSLRSTHNAGCALRASAEKFLREYDDTSVASTISSNKIYARIHPHPRILDKTVERPLKFDQFGNSNWGILYRLLRANFDGFASVPYPQPPPARPGDGQAVYLTGRQVTDIKLVGEKVAVHYTDVTSGEHGTLSADLVIGADGIHSTVRNIVQAPSRSEYSGFVAWRGVVPESELAPSTVESLNSTYSYDVMYRTYILCYYIPTENGELGSGERLVNWIWYVNVPEGSKEMTDIFTDRNGKLHSNTVGQGLVSPAVWQRMRDEGTKCMSQPLAELVNKTEHAFVTKVNDVNCTRARFLDGRVLLIGDALSTPRANLASSTEQAASHALWLGQAMRGETTMEEWEKKVCVFSERLYLLGRLVSNLGLGTWFAFLRHLRRYLAFTLRVKWRGS